MDRINLKFENFEPTHDDIQKIKAKIGYALGKGPSDASATATIAQIDSGFTCMVKVHSLHGHFNIESQAADIETLYKETCVKMVSDFDEWHKNPEHEKFSHKSMGHKGH